MVHVRYNFTDFTDITGEVLIPNVCHYWKCRAHGNVQIVKYYGRADGPVEWTCPLCLEEHLNKPIKSGKCRPACKTCGRFATLEQCAACGEDCCASHRVEGTCDDCWESTNPLVGYSGL